MTFQIVLSFLSLLSYFLIIRKHTVWGYSTGFVASALALNLGVTHQIFYVITLNASFVLLNFYGLVKELYDKYIFTT